MNRSIRRPGLWAVAVMATAVASAGCHHVIIDGGLEPDGTRHDEEWNLAFAAAIFPAKVDASGYCDGHFADVETRQSFLNVVVTAFTWGIISPMETRIGCGVPGSGSQGAGSQPGSAAGVQAGEEANDAR